MTILVTAASGQLGRLVVDSLLARGAAPADVVASARDTSKLEQFAARGIRTVELDYARPETIAAALDGVDTVLLVSGSEPGNRAALHQNVIDAAKAAGVTKLVYTSVAGAATADFVLAPDHKATEAAIAASGVPAVIVRHNWYTENYAADVSRAASTGVIAASTADGRVASATRADLAEGAAVVLLEDGHLGRTYEFGGDVAWNYDELAAAASEIVGRAVTYTPLTTAEHVAALESAGLDAGTAGFVAAIDDGIARGVLSETDGTLSRLLGRPTTSLVDGLRAVVAVEDDAAA
ncbi:NAD(P)-dependent oxidoreductase [Agromyces sp. Root81]|uniref:SDR family oxidoreductase n=1 Tax=Agromyces sp. Root81 TaxID=1736601 RepID=UPI0006FA5B46|nr:SDR family oxidoreductase [Agromyces sp. Root81]KRC61065.1 NAD(P)-dependent oxidoreductase [Agromyces sp. Root81]